MSNVTLQTNRTYKATLFEMIFSNKKELLSLYNAVSGSDYKNPEELEINTLENAIYMTMHNDISFVIGYQLLLYEHQSTVNPNIPLRMMFYMSDLYSKITKDKNLYGKSVVKIPFPRFYVFYNGAEKQPENRIYKLSDMYEISEDQPELELTVRMLNINKGYNAELLAACKTLADYVEYTARIREYSKGFSIEEAVERAITECIREGILTEFLSSQRSEAKKMSIYEYDQEKHMKMEREQCYAAGKADGIEIGEARGKQIGEARGKQIGERDLLLKMIKIKLEKQKSIIQIADELEVDEAVIAKLIEEIKVEA